MTRPRLIVVGPVPPPYHGVTISTSLVLANPVLRERFDVEHLDTSDPRPDLANIGRWDLTNVTLGLRNVAQFVRRLRGSRGVVYLPLPQNTAAFLRESLFILAAAAAGWRVTAHLRGGEFREFYRAQPALVRAWIRVSLGRVTSVAVMGESLRGLFDGVVPRERIAVVPNGTPDPRPEREARDDQLVVFLGNLLARKGVAEAVEAALHVRARHPPARFLFVGEFQDPALERDVLERVDGDEHIQFLPPLTGAAKHDLLLRAGVFLFPPVLPEGHPRVVLEALAAGLPIVTTDRGAIAETVVDGVTGFVLPEPDPEHLADRLLRLLRDADLRKRMSAAARARYLERFTEEAADRRLADWLSAVAAA